MKNNIFKYINENNIEALLLNSRYQKGYVANLFSGSGWVFIYKEEVYILVDGRYYEEIKAQNNIDNVIKIESKAEMLNYIKQIMQVNNIKSLTIENNIDIKTYLELKKFAQIDVSELKTFRSIKKDWEIEKIRKAAFIGDKVFEKIKESIKPGVSEKEIASQLIYLSYKFGGDRHSFEPVVVSGERGALPHGKPGNRKIQTGDLITMDFGVEFEHYASDMTRTIAVGKTQNSKLKEIYSVVLEAQKRAIESVKSGVTAETVDKAAREYISKQGYGKYFVHNTGHGLGIEVHEYPNIAPKSDVKLKAGMVITIEPGIYLPAIGGVRIEDDILVTKTGYEVLTKSPKEWIQID